MFYKHFTLFGITDFLYVFLTLPLSSVRVPDVCRLSSKARALADAVAVALQTARNDAETIAARLLAASEKARREAAALRAAKNAGPDSAGGEVVGLSKCLSCARGVGASRSGSPLLFADGSGQNTQGLHLFPPFGRLALDPNLFHHPQPQSSSSPTGNHKNGAGSPVRGSGVGSGSGAVTGAVPGDSPYYGRGVGIVDALGAPLSMATNSMSGGNGLAMSSLDNSPQYQQEDSLQRESTHSDDGASLLSEGGADDNQKGHPPQRLLANPAPPPEKRPALEEYNQAPPIEIVDELAHGRPISGGAGSGLLRSGRIPRGRNAGSNNSGPASGVAQQQQQQQRASSPQSLRRAATAHRALAGPTSLYSGARPMSANGRLRSNNPAPAVPQAMTVVHRGPGAIFYGAQRGNPPA